MASTDARPVLRKNAAARIYFPILDADGDLVSGASGLDSEVSLDGGAFSDCTNEATEIGSSGIYYLELTAGETNADAICVQVKTSTSGAKTTPMTFYPEEEGDIRVNATAWGGTAVASANVLIDGAVTAAKIANDAITAAKIASNAITTAKINDGAFTAAKFAADYFTGVAAGVWNALTSGLTTVGSIGKLLVDKLGGVSGQVASQSEVTAIQNNTRVVRVVPEMIERPDSGTQTYRVELLLYDDTGNMEAPDSAPTIALVNQAGTDRSSRLDSTTMSLVATGRYRAIYTADAADALEQLVWTFSVIEGGATRVYGNQSLIVDTTAVDFTSADRTKLDALHGKLPSKAFLAGTDNADGDIEIDEATGTPADSAGVVALAVVLADLTEDDGGTYRFTQNALEQAPAGGGGGGDVTAIRDLLEADRYIDTGQNPWQLVLIKAGTGNLATGTRLLVQNLRSTAGAALVSTDTVVGQSTAP